MLAVIRLAIYLSPEPYRSRFYSLMLRSSFLSRHAKVVCNARVDCACGIGVAHGRLTCGASLPSYPSACRPSPCRLGRAGEPPSGLAPRPGSRPKVSFIDSVPRRYFVPAPSVQLWGHQVVHRVKGAATGSLALLTPSYFASQASKGWGQHAARAEQRPPPQSAPLQRVRAAHHIAEALACLTLPAPRQGDPYDDGSHANPAMDVFKAAWMDKARMSMDTVQIIKVVFKLKLQVEFGEVRWVPHMFAGLVAVVTHSVCALPKRLSLAEPLRLEHSPHWWPRSSGRVEPGACCGAEVVAWRCVEGALA